jgi:cytochrome d ubiquinol oxidase subunit II
MESIEVLQTIWFFVLGIIFIAYSLLDGFDLGIGSLLPFLSESDEDTSALIRSIGPVWDGNEVWLLLSGGALFAAFPHVYATVFSGFYLVIMLIIFSLMFRAVSIEFWSLDNSNRKLWKRALAAGSFLPSLLFGVVLGNLIQGVPMNNQMEFNGNLLTLFRPFPLATGLLGLTAILMQGVTYAALKTGGETRKRAKSITGKIWNLYLAAFITAFAAAALFAGNTLSRPAAWVFGVIVLASIILIKQSASKENDLIPFLCSSAAFSGLWGIAASVQFPHLVRGTAESPVSLTIYNSSSGETTLTVIFIAALVGIPIVLGYTFFIYRIFRGRVN